MKLVKEKNSINELVSIVVPVYNVENYIEKCIESILSQDYQNIEIILVDDGSTDNSLDYCQQAEATDTRVRVFSKKNGGLSDARNYGIRKATGKWITFIDSDDYVTKDYVSYLYKLVIDFEADISIATYSYVTEKKHISRETGEVSLLDVENSLRRMLLDDGFDMGAWAKMYSLELFKDIEYPVGRLYEDSGTTYKLISKAKRIAFGSKSVYFYVNRSESIVNAKFTPRKLDLIEMNKQMHDFIVQHYPKLENAARRRLIWAYFSTLNQLLFSNDPEMIKRYQSQIVNFILSQKDFFSMNNDIPKRDRLAWMTLRRFGVKGYKRAWKYYQKILK